MRSSSPSSSGFRLSACAMVQGDTERIATGVGTGGSSSISCGGASVDRAAKKLGEQLKELRPTPWKPRRGDLQIADGAVRVAGTDRVVSFADSPRTRGRRPRSSPRRKIRPPKAPTYPNGTHLVEVEIDPDTGEVAITTTSWSTTSACTLNPLLLAGQVHGGAVQGIGQALMESTVYERRPASWSPRASWTTRCRAPATRRTSSSRRATCRANTNPLGVKGAGEAGAIGSCPAVMNAVVDALWRGSPHPPHRHAGDAAAHLAGDPFGCTPPRRPSQTSYA